MTVCRGPRCGKPVRWVRLESGKKTPLDPEPTEDGTIRLLERRNRSVGRVLKGLELDAARQAGERLYRSHFARCPDAEDWRKA